MPGTFARGTLGRQLLLRVLLIVAAIAVLLSSASLLTISRQLNTITDSQLTSIGDRLRGSGPQGPYASSLLRGGQQVGTLYAVFESGTRTPLGSGMLTTPNGPAVQQVELQTMVLNPLGDVSPSDGPSTIRLPGLGRYRVIAYAVEINAGQQDGVLVIGIPLADNDQILTKTLFVAGIGTALALIGAAVAVQAVVRRSLLPLNRVAATAQQVSQLPLDRGEVALALRVAPSDADPVSEVGRVGQAFNHMLDNVAGALAARQTSETKLKQFIADASHELRNPLASIRGYAELTRRERDQVPHDTAYALGRVEAEAERMSALVEDLLLLARLDSGPAIDLAPVDVTELLVNAVSDARAAGPDHHWSIDLGPFGAGTPGQEQPPATVLGDRNRLHQAVVNLLANARTHTPPGTWVHAGLRLETDAGVGSQVVGSQVVGSQVVGSKVAGSKVAGRQAGGSQVVIAITDNGPGIPADIQDRVFERFTRGDDSRARAGDRTGGSTGLGLAIVAAVAEAHHGEVRVRSVPGDTRFELRLPLADPS
jgi:two-component system OmpR family sensor kinase